MIDGKFSNIEVKPAKIILSCINLLPVACLTNSYPATA